MKQEGPKDYDKSVWRRRRRKDSENLPVFREILIVLDGLIAIIVAKLVPLLGVAALIGLLNRWFGGSHRPVWVRRTGAAMILAVIASSAYAAYIVYLAPPVDPLPGAQTTAEASPRPAPPAVDPPTAPSGCGDPVTAQLNTDC